MTSRWCITARAGMTSILICLLSAAMLPPVASQTLTYKPPELLTVERELMDDLTLRARPLDMRPYVNLIRPLRVDYSDNVTYVRCQNWGGGCMVYASLACADIINEWQAPYTPDLSWQYALRTWDELYASRLRTDPAAGAPDLNDVFNPGVASEGLCRSESDYLVKVAPNHAAIAAVKGDRMYWDPAPTAEARAEAANYKFQVSEPITPSVETLKTLLLTYGPVWAAGPWWWNGAHAMTVVGYDDSEQKFTVLDSAGDWSHARGMFKMAYSDCTDYIDSLRTVQPLPTERYQGRWAYSSRIRITGAWRGTYTVNIGVQGQVPQTVYRTYGRLSDRPFCYGERLVLDVPLPAYAADFWPPRSDAKWYLQVEDNDNDGRQGTIVEWILARRYEDPNCLSVDHWKTEEYAYSQQVTVPDATGAPEVSKPAAPNNTPPAQPSSQSGKVTLNLPENQGIRSRLTPTHMILASRISLDAEQATVNADGNVDLPGRLTSVTGQPLAGKTVELCELVASPNVNRPDEWKKLQTAVTDADGRFHMIVKVPPLTGARQVLGAVYRSAAGETLCSSKPLVREASTPRWRQVNVPIRKLVPELDGPMPRLTMPVMRQMR